MIERYINEYLSICKYAVSSKKVIHETDLYICLEREFAEKLLNKYMYDEAKNKLKLWKMLGLIACDKDRFVKQFRLDGKYKKLIAISKQHLEIMSEIQSKTAGNSKQ